MQTNTTATYTLEGSILPCPFKHTEEEQLKTCGTCKEQADKIESALYFWFEFPEIRKAIEDSELAGRVTTLDLEYHNESEFVTQNNFTKLSTKVTPQPLVFGYSKAAPSPFLAIRFLDTIHNEKHGIDSRAKSFGFVTIVPIAHVGPEPCLTICKSIIKDEKYAIKKSKKFSIDCGRMVGDYVVSLIKGELNGKRVV